MLQLPIALKLIISLILGAFIGLERESYEQLPDKTEPDIKTDLAVGVGPGVRTFSLITLLGAVTGLMRAEFFWLFIIVNICFMFILLTSYVLSSVYSKDIGFTTELAVLFSYLIGLFIALDVFSVQLILAFTVVLVLIMSQKRTIKTFVAGLHRSEVTGFISFLIIALVILPFLPNTNYSIGNIPGLVAFFNSYGLDISSFTNVELFNPFTLWLVVALITGVDVVGYILEKTVGQKKGWLFTSIAGGFVSSTAVTQTLAIRSKTSDTANRLAAAAVFANLASFFQIFILIATLNSKLLVESTLFIFSLIISSLIAGLILLRNDKRSGVDNLKETKKKLQEVEIFALKPALKFAIVFLLIQIVTKVSLHIFGNQGFLLTSSLASLTGLDAVTINISQLSTTAITFETAILALIFANAVNILGKVLYSFLQGSREFAVRFGVSMIFVILVSFVGLLG